MGLLDFFTKTNTLFFPGCTTYHKNKEGLELYKLIFAKLGIKLLELEKNQCSGIELLEAGYEQEARKQARKNLSIFQENDIKSIITTDPKCYKIFTQDYKEFLPDLNIEVINIWQLILNQLRKKHHLIKNKPMEIITFHDSCYLGRHSNIYDEPRKILEALGYQIEELDNNKEDCFCCGSCGNLPFTNPELANKIAKEKISQVKRIGIKKMIVTSFDNYNLLKKNSENSGVEILELSDVIAKSLDIQKIIYEEEIEGEEKILAETRANMRLKEELKDEDYYDESY
jgi:Fe-S oxidoreductase|tara:strand:- start:1436 stop:2290 length:855 start_codon:yes stop_codon:yes gene_type:complete